MSEESSRSDQLGDFVQPLPRQPLLAWCGRESLQGGVSVPTQVVEIVRPGRALGTKGELSLPARTSAKVEDSRPENRVIWTNDNVVALQNLVDERDELTKGFRYRGRVDVVYIDPPFMIGDAFTADNTIDVTLSGDADVELHKEPSLVELLAYLDTWGQGLDSFLSMMRARLELLKLLLAPTGTIYVHLDWHAIHYVKVLMDEIFQYGNFQSEIIWKRTSARSDVDGIATVHESILAYSGGPKPFRAPVHTPYTPEYIQSHYRHIDRTTGKRYRLNDLRSPSPRPNLTYEWKGYKPHKNGWSIDKKEMAKRDAAGLIYYPPKGSRLASKKFLDDEGMPLMSVWTDIPPVNSQAQERLGYPTQKPVALLERIIATSCPQGGLVLDCFAGSGTTAEAAERLGRRWICIDNSKYAIHLTRKRMIHLEGQPKPSIAHYDYSECPQCKNINRKERRGKSADVLRVRPFTMENMGVYQRASEWQGFQQNRSAYRDEMIRVFGGEPVKHSPLLHGRKGGAWVHVGPLDAPVSCSQVWQIAREAQRTDIKSVIILSADFDTLAASDRDEIKMKTHVGVVIRVIPASAIDEVRRRIDMIRTGRDTVPASTTIPAFYAPLSLVVRAHVAGRSVEIELERCEVDIESFIASQRPLLKPKKDAASASARNRAAAEAKRWRDREKELLSWLKRAGSWRSFIDFWAVDWNYGRLTGDDGKPIFVTEWQTFRGRGGEAEDELTFSAKFSYVDAGRYRVAARVTDVFGNDGIASVDVDIKR
jgi:adenine-specific DNA-methyltransferase